MDKLGSSSLTHPRLEAVDYLTVPCARCRGQMCWLCGEVPDYSKRNETHYCTMVRAEGASYDYCSSCYTGPYQVGGEGFAETSGNMAPDQKVYLVGTMNGWATSQAMEHMGGSAEVEIYERDVVLDDCLMEKFHIAIVPPGGVKQIFYPVKNTHLQHLRVLGPRVAERYNEDRKKYWLLDGRADGARSGTAYRIRFEWGKQQRLVSWFPLEARSASALASNHKFVIASKSFGWGGAPLQEVEAGLWEHTSTMPSRGTVEVQILRDGDKSQAIYPLQHEPRQTSVPVLGPDENADGRAWVMKGARGEQLTVQLRFHNGNAAVTFANDTLGERTWMQGPPRGIYHVSGSWNKWDGLGEMESDPASPGVFRYTFVIGERGFEQFQIIANSSWEMRIFPSVANVRPGESSVMGPAGAAGHSKNWKVSGYWGQMMEITLDLDAEDQINMVSCRELVYDEPLPEAVADDN